MGVQFDIKKDNMYPCFCQACLAGKTGEQMSKRDMRYCLGCQSLIEGEHKIRGEKYIPVPLDINIQPEVVTESKSSCPKTQPKERYAKRPKTKKSTLNADNAKVDNFKSRGRPTSYKKRSLPDDKIKQLHQQGMGAKAIASKLKKEQGIVISYKTIQRILSGERKEVVNG